MLQTTNAVVKATAREGSDLFNYIKSLGLIQLVPSTDEEGEICLAFTETTLVTVYFDWGKLIAEHYLPCGDCYVQEFTVKGEFLCDEVQGLEIPVFCQF